MILAGFAWYQTRTYMPAYHEDDPDAYLILAKRIAAGLPLAERDPDPFVHQQHMWVENAEGNTIPKFAPGYPALMAGAYLAWDHAPAVFLGLGGFLILLLILAIHPLIRRRQNALLSAGLAIGIGLGVAAILAVVGYVYRAPLWAFYEAHLKLAYRDETMYLVSPVCATLTILGAYLLFALWARPWSALAGAALVALSNSLMFYGGYLLTHAAEICFVTWGMYFLWKWWRATEHATAIEAVQTPVADNLDPMGAVPAPNDIVVAYHIPSGIIWALLAGLTLGFSATIRHTSSLLVVVVVFIWIARLIGDIRAKRLNLFGGISFSMLPLAYALFPILLMLYNKTYFGDYFTTGYDLSKEQHDLSTIELRAEAWNLLIDNIPKLFHGLSYHVGFIVFSLAIISMAAIGRGVERVARWLWFIPLFLAIAIYYYAPDNMVYFRFVFTLMPLLVGAALMTIDRIALSRGARALVLIVIVGIAFINSVKSISFAAGFDISDLKSVRRAIGIEPTESGQDRFRKWPKRMEDPYREPVMLAARACEETLQDNAIIFARDGAHFCVGARRHFTLYPLKTFQKNNGREYQSAYRHPSTPKMQPERKKRLGELYTNMSQDDLNEKQRDLVRTYLLQGRQVVFLVDPGWGNNLANVYKKEFAVKELRKIDLAAYGTWGLYEATLVGPTTNPGN